MPDPQPRPAPAVVLPGRFRLACFDMDGLLVDSEPTWIAAERGVVERRGQAFTAADLEASHGRALIDTAAVFSARLGIPPEVVTDEIFSAMRVAFLAGMPAHEGALELLAALRGRIPMTVVSNTGGRLVGMALEGLGLTGVFEAVVSGDDLGRPKPLPDVYLDACRRVGVAPADAIAFEDSPMGVAAARAAGLFTVGVPDRDVDLWAAGADVVLRSLAEVVVEAG